MPGQVLPDILLRTKDCGEAVGPGDVLEWQTFLETFFSTHKPVAAPKPKGKGKAKAKAKAGVKRPRGANYERLSAHRLMRTLDYLLLLVYGCGLARFCPTGEFSPLASRPLLVLCQDEGSPGFAMVWFLLYKTKARVLSLRDPFHRFWNDVCAALKGCGLWWPVLLTTVAFNFTHGPWAGAAWWEKLVGGAREYFQLEDVDSPLFSSFYAAICRDKGLPAVGTTSHKAKTLAEAGADRSLQAKGAKVALRRWFGWVGAATSHDAGWHTRLLVLYFVALRLKLYKKNWTPHLGGEGLTARRKTWRTRKTQAKRRTPRLLAS